jgi:hypothetical protein
MLLAQGLVQPGHHDSKELKETKAQIRQAIWERTALDNPLAMVSFVHGLRYVGESDESANSRLFLKDPSWEGLHTKLFQLHEIRMSKLREGKGAPNSYISLNDLIAQEAAQVAQGKEGIKLLSAEQALLSKIQSEGVRAAKEFVNIRFPFTPFINDTLFENADYSDAGSEFYRRRAASDLPAFSSAYEAFVKLMGNPGGTDPEKALEVLHEMVEALGSPLSTEGGQNKVLPFTTAYFQFIEMGGNAKNRFTKELRKWNIANGIIHALRKPNSIAQEYAGIHAAAKDEEALLDLAHKAAEVGVLNHHLVEKIKKKFGLSLWKLLFAGFRNLAPILIVSAVGEFFKESGKDVEI